MPSYRAESLSPDVPRKVIVEDHSLIDVFKDSASFAKVMSYLQSCSDAVASVPREQRVTPTVAECCPTVRYLVEVFFPFLDQLVTDIPLEDLAQQRFGNKAKRTFHLRMEEQLPAHMEALVRTLPVGAAVDGKTLTSRPAPYSYTYATQGGGERSAEEVSRLAVELGEYIKDSFGNAVRLDYGSGHELHFFIALMICLEEHGDMGGTLHDTPPDLVPLAVPPPPPVPVESREATRRLRQEFVFYAFWTYLDFMRRVQTHYSLEPAGSHGVWGLDDYHFIPYIFGGAQLIGADEPRGAGVILPKHICDKKLVAQYKDSYMYFGMVQWILDNKHGPFHEHSSMLYNISGVPFWHKVYGGMIKMFAVEVLSKFNVNQHLLFGRHLPWNTKTLPE